MAKKQFMTVNEHQFSLIMATHNQKLVSWNNEAGIKKYKQEGNRKINTIRIRLHIHWKFHQYYSTPHAEKWDERTIYIDYMKVFH